MQSKDLIVGTVYCYVIHFRTGGFRHSHLGDNDYNNKRGVLVEVKGGKATFEVGKQGQHVTVATKNVLGTWDEQMAALQASQDSLQRRKEQVLAEVKARNEARLWLRETLGTDWAEGLPTGLDTKAEPNRDYTRANGACIQSSSFYAILTTVHFKALVEKAYRAGHEVGYEAARIAAEV